MSPRPTDTYRDTFLRLMADGMNYAEALECFDLAEFHAAAMAELEDAARGAREAPALFQLLVRAQFEQRNSVHGRDYQQALDLWQAGWTSETPHESTSGPFWSQSQVMSWYWRRPSRRPGKPGRRYLSTNQAWNAMKREQ